jgi:hypothetical protein
LDKEGFGFRSKLTGTADKEIIIRALPGERVTIDSPLVILGAHTVFWGLEFTASDFKDRSPKGAQGRRGPINIYGDHIKLINLHVHDGPSAIGFWSNGEAGEMYGCIVHDFGFARGRRGHGHALYVQNEIGEKKIIDNIMFRGYGMNLHAYSEKGSVKGLHIEGNISFSAGQRIKGQVYDDILVSAFTPADRIQVIRNFTYQPPGDARLGGSWRPAVRVDSYGAKPNKSCEIRDNVIIGARGLQVGLWENAVITGNTIWSSEVLATIKTSEDKLKNYKWDSNHYLHTGQSVPFVLPLNFLLFRKFENVTFDRWKKLTGFDRNSKWIKEKTKLPSGTWVYVRPNKYEPGRGHIAVYNWENKSEVSVDINAIVKPGNRFEIRNVQQDLYGKPVVSGSYDGKPVFVPTARSEIAPHFEAYLVTSVP